MLVSLGEMKQKISGDECTCAVCRDQDLSQLAEEDDADWKRVCTDWEETGALCRSTGHPFTVELVRGNKHSEGIKAAPTEGGENDNKYLRRLIYDPAKNNNSPFQRDANNPGVWIGLAPTKFAGDREGVGQHMVALVRIICVVETANWYKVFPTGNDRRQFRTLEGAARKYRWQLVVGELESDRIILKAPVLIPSGGDQGIKQGMHQHPCCYRLTPGLICQVKETGRQLWADRPKEKEKCDDVDKRRQRRPARLVENS